MDPVQTIANFLIGIGAIIMASNIKKFRDVILILKAMARREYSALRPLLMLHQTLIISFLAGYLIVLVAINSTEIEIGNLFVGLIFFSGALFVLLGIILQNRMIQSIKTTYMDTLSAYEKLSKTNTALTREIREKEAAKISLQRSYDTQTVVNRLLKESLEELSVNEVVNRCLDLVLSLPWLSFESQGCIFLVEEEPEILIMKAQRGLSKALEKECRQLPFGRCLCGKAASTRKVVYAGNIDERHDILLPGTPDHGHYCIPILAKNRILGVINIYVKPGHKRNDWEEDFLKAVANTLAVILIQRYGDDQKKEIETRLQQAQKMESIGTLAGGIAHDFNNILSGIYGYTQLAQLNVNNPEKVQKKLEQIQKGANRASDLTQQILTFSRKTEQSKKAVKIRPIVIEAVRFLRSSIPSSIQIREDMGSQARILANPTQIHQIVMNLCTNSFHAMKETGGKLSISLRETQVESDLGALGLNPGDYVVLEVKDTGTGIVPEVMDKIFDPYFTTKKVREGTGLGLAVVLGIVKEHGGEVKAVSHPGEGACFSVYFPVLSGWDGDEGAGTDVVDVQGGEEHLLLVDDEESILNSTAELLTDYGYRVSGFNASKSAFKAFEAEPGSFDLIITDMTMPEMTGLELSLKVLEIQKTIPIILCTGYSDNISKAKALKMGIAEYLQKPVDSRLLLMKIRQIIDG